MRWTGVAASGDVEVVELDPKDDAAFAQWFAVVEASDLLERPDDPSWLQHEQQRASLSDEDNRKVMLAAVQDGAVVGAARMELPQKDNEHLCEAVLVVHPDARRRGIARALDEELVRRARGDGRTTVLVICDEPPGADRGNRLAAVALGYDVVQHEVRRDIDLPLDPTRVAELERACAEHAAEYDVRTWWDRCPDDLAEDCAQLNAAMSTDVPKDQMDWREEVWDVARLRRNEQHALEMDRTYVGAGAVHRPTGRMVAYTTMGVPRSLRRRAYQWDTLVLREHRGHRLGMLVKLAALQELTASSPKTAYISTWNAQENGPMIAVNDALGARTNGGVVAVQKVLG
ncbi:MAG: GCN5-related N-acetyltransferase [Frankiales bacterium]|nr:GCN5-related N-acetyltransferase [Frankiales bacterium]